MTIQEWVEQNVKPNVLSVGAITPVGPGDNGVSTYDVSVMVKKGETQALKSTQTVYQIGTEFFFGPNIIVNEVEKVKITPEETLLTYLDATYGADNYTIHPPIDLVSGKAAVISVDGQKLIIAMLGGKPVAKKFSEV